MSKISPILLIMKVFVLLTACGSTTSWENEDVTVVNGRILSDQVQAAWSVEGDKSKQIRIEIKKKDGGTIDQFEVNHEKLLHLIVISKDLSYFNHIHPKYKGNGVFEIANEFPSGGEYRLIADFKPEGGDSMTKMAWMKIEGERGKPAPVLVDAKPEKTFDGKKVTLAMDQPAAGKELTLKFSLADAETDRPITDLQPYLGAIGHVVILSQNGERYLHVHAEEGQGTGPDAVFQTTFPRSGTYKIWGQFQRDHLVFTVSYVVSIP